MSFKYFKFLMMGIGTMMLTLGNPAKAFEAVDFSSEISKPLQSFLSQNTGETSETYMVSKADLNQDFMPEYIIRQQDCKDRLCRFFVVAQTDQDFISLLDFKARKIALSDQNTNGVRNILAFKNALNDFDYDVYTWEATRQKYVKRQ